MKPPFAEIAFAPAKVTVEELSGGGMILRSPQLLEPYEPHLGRLLRHWAAERPDERFLAERAGDGWRAVTWSEALRQAETMDGTCPAGAE